MFELPLSAPSHKGHNIACEFSLPHQTCLPKIVSAPFARSPIVRALVAFDFSAPQRPFIHCRSWSFQDDPVQYFRHSCRHFRDYPAVDDYHAPLSPPGVGDTRSSCRQIRSAHLGPCPVGIVVNQGPPDSCLVDRICLGQVQCVGWALRHCGTALTYVRLQRLHTGSGFPESFQARAIRRRRDQVRLGVTVFFSSSPSSSSVFGFLLSGPVPDPGTEFLEFGL